MIPHRLTPAQAAEKLHDICQANNCIARLARGHDAMYDIEGSDFGHLLAIMNERVGQIADALETESIMAAKDKQPNAA